LQDTDGSQEPQEELQRLRRRVAELEVQARRFQALVDSGVLSVQVYRSDGQTAEVNAGWHELWGLSLEHALGYNILRDTQLQEHGMTPALTAVFHDGRAIQLPAIRYDPTRTEGIETGKNAWVASLMAPVNDAQGVREVVQLHVRVGELKQTEDELLAHNQRLEEAVRARTAELTEKLQLIEQQQQQIHALSTPVLQIWDRVLALPVIGRIDGDRAKSLLEALLAAVVETRSEHVLIDITGVPLVDVEALGCLRDAVRATQLLGARCSLVGISPAIAEAMVELDLSLDRVPTYATLQDGLRQVLAARASRRSRSTRA
jgi:rsbT co-antagonist protein RsbR